MTNIALCCSRINKTTCLFPSEQLPTLCALFLNAILILKIVNFLSGVEVVTTRRKMTQKLEVI